MGLQPIIQSKHIIVDVILIRSSGDELEELTKMQRVVIANTDASSDENHKGGW
jgi:hypothetical protein